MKIECARYCVIKLQRLARWPVWLSGPHFNFKATEGNFLSFAAIAPLTKVWMPTCPDLTTGCASGPAFVSGPIGLYGKQKAASWVQYLMLLACVSLLLVCAVGSAFAKDDSNDIGGAPRISKVNLVVGNAALGAVTDNPHIDNHPPLAADDILHLSQKPMQINVLANDTDLDGDLLVLTDAAAMHGAVAFTASGLVAYGLSPSLAGPDIITYTINDGNGGSAVGQILVSIK